MAGAPAADLAAAVDAREPLSRRRALHGVGLRSLLVLIATLFALAASEAVLRGLGVGTFAQRSELVGQVPHIIRDADLGWALKPGLAEFAINSAGVRSPHEFTPARNGKPRIALLGDSVLYGKGDAWAESAAGQLEQMLGGAERVEVLNFSVPGYGTDQEWLCYRRKVRSYKPDWVVVGVALCNDVGNNCYDTQYGTPKPKFELRGGRLVQVASPRDHALLCVWRQRSSLVNALWLATHRAANTEQMSRFCIDERNPTYAAGLRLTLALLRELISDIRRDGAKPLILLLPYQTMLTNHDHADNPLRREVVRFGSRADVPVLDLLGAFREQREAALFLPKDIYHYGGRGHELVAEAVVERYRASEGPNHAIAVNRSPGDY